MNKYNRIVVKIGSSTLTYPNGALNLRRMDKIVEVLADIKNSGVQTVVVSSGAQAVGLGKLGFKEKPKEISAKQAIAAVGQCELMYIYDKLFSEYNHTVAQVLLTGDDIADGKRRGFVENTLFKLLDFGCIPIINENDTVAVDEIVSIGDNDTLSAIVSQLIGADLLVLMSDIEGLFDGNPRRSPDAKLIPVIDDLDLAASYCQGAGSALGTGGMDTKIGAAKIARDIGADMIIMDGSRPEKLYDAVEGRPCGTLFPFGNSR